MYREGQHTVLEFDSLGVEAVTQSLSGCCLDILRIAEGQTDCSRGEKDGL